MSNRSSATRFTVRWGFATLALALPFLVGCSDAPLRVSTMAPPVVVCGTTLYGAAPNAPAVLDIVGDHGTSVDTPPFDYPPFADLMFRVANGCQRGSAVEISPPGNFSIAKVALAADGLPAAVVLAYRSGLRAEIVARQG